MTTVDGWRYELLAPPSARSGIKVPASHLSGRFATSRARSATAWLPFRAFTDDGKVGPAHCDAQTYGNRHARMQLDKAEHDAPGLDCQCGYRVVQDLATLSRYLNASELWFKRGGHGTKLPPVGIYRVRAQGTIIPGSVATDDPPGTVRCSHLQMVGPAWLPATGAGRQAARFLRRIDPTPEIRYVPNPRRLTLEEVG